MPRPPPAQKTSSTAPVSTVNWARHAFFTCPRGKSQSGQGKQICCFTFFVGAQVLFLLLFFFLFLACAFTCMNTFLGCMSFMCLPSFFSVHFVLCQILVIIHSYMIRQPNTAQNTKQTTDQSKQRRQPARAQVLNYTLPGSNFSLWVGVASPRLNADG